MPIEFPPKDDGTREADLDFQRKIDEIIFTDLSNFDVPFQKISGSIEQRGVQVINAINAKLNYNGK